MTPFVNSTLLYNKPIHRNTGVSGTDSFTKNLKYCPGNPVSVFLVFSANSHLHSGHPYRLQDYLTALDSPLTRLFSVCARDSLKARNAVNRLILQLWPRLALDLFLNPGQPKKLCFPHLLLADLYQHSEIDLNKLLLTIQRSL